MFDRPKELLQACVDGDKKKIEKWHRNKSWYDQPQNIAGTWYLEAVKELFKENMFWNGELELFGNVVGPEDMKCDYCYLLSGEDDEITTTSQVFNLSERLSCPVECMVVPDTGHIGTFVKGTAMEYWKQIKSNLV